MIALKVMFEKTGLNLLFQVYFLTTNMYMKLFDQCVFSLVTLQYGLFLFIYCLRYPWAHKNG